MDSDVWYLNNEDHKENIYEPHIIDKDFKVNFKVGVRELPR